MEATFYDDTPIAEPVISKETFSNFRFSKLSGAKLDCTNFVSGKLQNYERELRDTFIHRIGVSSPQNLGAKTSAGGNTYVNSAFNTSPYNIQFVRAGQYSLKEPLDNILNNNNGTDYWWLAWNIAKRDNGLTASSYSTNNNRGVSTEMMRQSAYGHRKAIFQKRKLYYPANVYDLTNVQNSAWKYNPGNPKLYQGNYSYGHGITKSGSLDGAYSTRCFFDTVHHGNSTVHKINFINSALQFDGYWPTGLNNAIGYNTDSDPRPASYVFSFTPGSELGEGLKEPIIDSIANKITSMGIDHYKSYKYYDTEKPFRGWRLRGNHYYNTSDLGDMGGRVAIVDATVGGQSCVKFINLGNTTDPLTESAFRSRGDSRIELLSGKTYRVTGQYYIPSSNSKINKFQIWGLRSLKEDNTSNGQNITFVDIESGSNATINSWVGFTGTMADLDQDRYFRIQMKSTTSSFTNNGSDSGDFVGLKNLEIQELVTGGAIEAKEARYGYLEFSADDHFNGGSSYQFDNAFTIDLALNPDNVVTNAGGAGYLQNLTSPSEKIVLNDTKTLTYSYPRVTGFDLISQSIRESLAFEYQAQSENGLNRYRPYITTGSSNQYSYGVQLKESRPQGFKGAFLYPVYLGKI